MALGKSQVLVAKQPPRDASIMRATLSKFIRRITVTPTASSDKGGCDKVAEGSRRSRSRFALPWDRKRPSKDRTAKEFGPTNLSILHRSQSPLIDIVFVHGLRGGSVKTWQKGGDARRFWPKLWLPTEPGFEHANIHAFGYDADWDSEKGDIFQINDFGRQLIEEMRTSPQLTEDQTRPIIMLGHSMGGLVIKKAFIIARESSEWRDRIKSIFFLATPHRGSKYASILNGLLTILRVAPSRQYIGDLSKDSPALKAIHDGFTNAAGDIIIYSFYETLKMKIGLSSAYIVEKESAVLGIPNERVKYADATHCDISKYKTRSDSTYIAVRNSLALVVKELLEKEEMIKKEDAASKMTVIKAHIGAQDPPIERREVLPGSCQWIQEREEFRQWRTSEAPAELNGSDTDSTENISLLWVYAGPGTGKSFLASHVQSLMEATASRSTAYYYFRLGSHGSQSLAPFLRSIAYQMALTKEDVREKLSEMHQYGSALDIDDPWTVWVKLFKKCILKLRSRKPFFWIIDALDECENFAELFNMLKGEVARFPLRIFITSRPTGDMQRVKSLMVPRASMQCIEVPHEATMTDIRSYIMHRVGEESSEATSAPEPAAGDLADNILRKSSGCFLWVRLVLDELGQTHTAEGKFKVLDELPEGMRPLYKRSVDSIATHKQEQHISKAIFDWIVAGTRQMTLDELAEALEHDVSMTITKTAQAINELCGQLVVVKANSNVVELIHSTAREFLLSDAGFLTISQPEIHARIALICLKLLSGTELRTPRTEKALMHKRPDFSPLLGYAIESFSEHVLASSAHRGEEILAALEKFSQVNILGWIEKIVASGNCHPVLRVSRNLTKYLGFMPPRDPKAATILRWATDLSRLVTKFGEPLLKQPFSIYFLIPPMCPANTAIAQVPGRRAGGLVLSGSTKVDWDDCAAHVDLGDEGASAVSSGEENFIIGTDFGTVSMFNQRTYQREATFNHGNAVDLVHLTDGAIVICTTKAIILQDTQGHTVWQSRLRFRCFCVTVLGNKVVAVMSHGHLMKWNKATGEVLQDEQVEYKDHQPEAPDKYVRKRAPILAKISAEFELIVLGYSGGSVCLWDAEDIEFVGWIKDERGRVAKELLFNPNKNLQLLLVVYEDYGLATFDTWTTKIVQSHSTPADAPFLSAASSPDGHTFATADGQGNITLWNFKTLNIIGNIRTSPEVYRILSFTGDSLGILDVTDSSIKCWTPVAVAQHAPTGDELRNGVINCPGQVPKSYRREREEEISVIVTHPHLALTLTGNLRGDVMSFAVEKTGLEKQILYHHSASVLQIAISKTEMVASCDCNRSIMMGKYEAETGVLTHLNGIAGEKVEAHIRQLCFSTDGKFLLIAMDEIAAVYRCQDASCVGKWLSDDKETKSRYWIAAQSSETAEQQFWLLENHKLRRFNARSFPNTIEPSEILLEYSLAPGCKERETTKATLSSNGPQTLFLEVQLWVGMNPSSTVIAFDLSENDWGHPGNNTRHVKNILPDGSRHWQYLLGWNQGTAARIVFMDRDLWICSASLGELRKRECQRHFYVPRHLLAPNVSPALMATGDVVLPNGNGLISISGGFKFGYPANFI